MALLAPELPVVVQQEILDGEAFLTEDEAAISAGNKGQGSV
jgi:hypothetical protein